MNAPMIFNNTAYTRPSTKPASSPFRNRCGIPSIQELCLVPSKTLVQPPRRQVLHGGPDRAPDGLHPQGYVHAELDVELVLHQHQRGLGYRPAGERVGSLGRKPFQDSALTPNAIAQRPTPLRPVIRTDERGFGKKPKKQQRDESYAG